MYCENCGTKLEQNSEYCPNCGKKIIKDNAYNPNYGQGTYYSPQNYNNASYSNEQNNAYQSDRPVDKRNIVLNIISFLSPVVGLILWLATRKDRPIRARSMGRSALAGLIVGVVLSVLSAISVASSVSNNSNSGSENPSDDWSYFDNYDQNSDYGKNYFDDFEPE